MSDPTPDEPTIEIPDDASGAEPEERADGQPEQACPNPDNPEYVALWDRLQALLKSNMKKERLLSSTYGVGLDDASGLQNRLEMVTNAFLPINTPARLELEIEWQSLIQHSLEMLHNNMVMREKKAAGELFLPNHPGIIIPGKG